MVNSGVVSSGECPRTASSTTPATTSDAPSTQRWASSLGEPLPLRSPSLSFALSSLATAPRGGGSEVLMQVTRSLSARIRKWLGLLGKKPAKVPYGAGAWGR
jgi:hypothetical protein